jgi:hypothetical protein
MPNQAGLLGPAHRYSPAGMIASAAAGIGLGLVDLTMLWTVYEIPIVVQLHSYLLFVIVSGFLGSLVVFVGARVILGQRKTRAEIRELREALGSSGGPSPETVAAVRRLAMQVVHSD